MLRRGAAKKITVYVNEDARHHHGPLWEAILDYLLQEPCRMHRCRPHTRR